MHNYYIDSKSFLVDAREDDYSKIFSIWENKDGSYTSYEYIPDNYPAITVCVWNKLEDLIEGIAWHNWIIDGIKSETLRTLIINGEKL